MLPINLPTQLMEPRTSSPSKSSPTRQSPISTPRHLSTGSPDPPDSTCGQQTQQLQQCPNRDLERSTAADMPTNLDDEFAALSLNAPFGCTYLCGETFTTSIAWRQHEGASHRQQEIWRCCVPLTHAGAECGQAFYSTGTFATHLAGEHGVQAKDIARWVENGHIHAECQTNYWCGFCCKIVPLESYGTQAWHERFEHLQEHFDNGDSLAKGWLKLRE